MPRGLPRGGGGMGGFGIDWYIKENYKRSMDSFYQNFSSLFANHLKLHSRQYSICFCGKGGLLNISIADVWQESQSLWIAAQCMNKSSIQNLLTKLFTVGSSSGFNVKLLHDWSNFDLPRLMPVEHIFLMPSSCLSLTLILARIHANKLLITAQSIRNLRTPASAEMNKRGSL